MDDDFFNSGFDGIFEELADLAPLGSLPLPAFSASPFPQLPFPPSDFSNFCARRLAANPPSLFGASPNGLGTSSFTNSPLTGQIPSCPGRPANRQSAFTQRYPTAPTPRATLPTLPFPASFGNIPTASNAADSLPRSPWGHPSFGGFGNPFSPIQVESNSDDYYLNELATRDFSSPSIFTQSPHDTQNTANLSLGLSGLSNNFAPASDPGIEQSEAGLGGNDFKRETAPDEDDIPSSPSPTGTGSASSNMSTRPRARRSTRADAGETERPISSSISARGKAHPSSRLESGQTAPKKRKRTEAEQPKVEEDGFEEDKDVAFVDLADTEKVPDTLLNPLKPKNEIKLSAFQCVICMDDVTNLTVTHCGHLFCAECLHSSLHIDLTKRICPICRQKVENRPSSGKFNQKARGYYPLELKLTTKKSLGKRAAKS
ncbi:hypothetical protein B0T25DRAFT_163916 [Lasiosphaeria hispida]|uniref:RING-type domain-containing protein n=1 Tax=Lasiosphaeria hispida TaxID=260671 RepID=A0AAJ0HMF0_9PEZI|nr:hypothetical protein B0T25DRAFT_163916 [Lasiosphaeria hispida]